MKTILITGATNGIGLEAAVALAREGHHVVLVGRDAAKTARCVEDVRRRAGAGQVDALLCDFAAQASVRALAEAFLAKYARLDVLVLNAGLVAHARTLTPDGLETTFAVNHLGPFLLVNLLLERLKASAPARVVVTSSKVHTVGTLDLDDPGFSRGGYSLLAAYARSKLANVMMVRALARRLEGTGVTVNALHPGGVATGIYDNVAPWQRPLMGLAKRLFMLTPEQGSRTITFLATAPEVEGQTGLYFERNRARPPARLARDDARCEALWAKSAALVGL